MKKTTVTLGVLLLALPMTLTADTPAAWRLFASSYSDAIMNPPTGEDVDFFVSTGGVPNIMFVFDTSSSMLRMAPDGAATTWGNFYTRAGAFPGTVAEQTQYGCVNAHADSLRFHSPCGTLQKEGEPYDGVTDWASLTDANGRYCPHMRDGNQAPTTDEPGFDPDFFCPGGGKSCGKANFFDKNLVYRDHRGERIDILNKVDGWTSLEAFPYAPSGTPLTIAQFCALKGGADPLKVASCNSCMTTKGYWFTGPDTTDPVLDGNDLTHSYGYVNASSPDTSSSYVYCHDKPDPENYCRSRGYGSCTNFVAGSEMVCRIPKVYFSGNFLNFHPPKFVLARKVMKDVLSEVRRIRLGVAIFDSTAGFTTHGGTVTFGLNPNCKQLNTPSHFDSNRSSILNKFRTVGGIKFDSTGTPLAETLLNVGQLFRSASLPWFTGGSFSKTGWDEDNALIHRSFCYSCQQTSVIVISDGIPVGDGNIPGTTLASTAMSKAIADRGRPGGPSGPLVYAGDPGFNITEISDADCPVCNTAAEARDTTIAATAQCTGQQDTGACGDAIAGYPAIRSYLPKVAWYLQNVDLRPDTEIPYDNYALTGKQVLSTYTIGLATRPNASLILRHTAEAGGGLYNGGLEGDVFDAKSFKNAILKTLEDVNSRSTGFGTSALSPLQAAASQGVLIPRFEPNRSAHWNGHLYHYSLYSEFSSGTSSIPGFVPCQIPATGASGPANGDYDCDGKCNSVFLMDSSAVQPAFIMEDGTGQFVRNSPFNRASCGLGNLCGPGNCAVASMEKAVPIWDAGDKLAPVDFTTPTAPVAKSDAGSTAPTSFKPWTARRVFTVIDSNGDQRIDSSDTLVRLDSTNAQADAMAPYLNIRGGPFCGELASRLTRAQNTAGATIRAELAAGTYTTCAKTILQYLSGADVFNELANHVTAGGARASCPTFPATYCTRPYQLGDVFHSSPIEVHAPSPSTGFLCDTGLDSQCLASLYRTPTPFFSAEGRNNAYDDYAKSDRYRHRAKFALVGANDGLLHAIHTANWDDGAYDYVPGARTDSWPGEEVWAFIPPDLLAKLPLLMGQTHHYFLDGTPMVRDVWIDGMANSLVGAVGVDGVKQAGEFHTVAVVGERRGGTHYFALDVTDAGPDLLAAPRFLWIHPQPGDPEQLSFGNTWADFTPSPPPIGPVRVETTCADGVPRYNGGAGEVCYTEKWIVMLSGGFDVQYTKGRGVHMVDIGSGTELFDFSYPGGAASACDASVDPRCALLYPVASAVSMMAWGLQATFMGNNPNDFFFDTATFGDTGGQLWVLRFNEPGRLTGGKVGNWYGARVFQQKKDPTACALNYCGTQPFFHVPANVPLAVNGRYRVLAGTGDRYNLLDHGGGICGPDNIRACLVKGCSVTLDDGSGGPGAVYGVSPDPKGTKSHHMNHPATCTASPSTYSLTETAAPGTVVSKIGKLTISCPSAVVCPDDTGAAKNESVSKSTSVSCTIDPTTDEEYCVPTASNSPGMPIAARSSATTDKRNWFYSLLVFAGDGDRKIFRTQAEAIAYDAARLTDQAPVLANVNAGGLSRPDDNGWMLYFDHGEPSTPDTVALGSLSYHIYAADERVASTTGVGGGCAYWNTVQPGVNPDSVNATTRCPENTPCKAGKAQISYLYGASPATGAVCLLDRDGSLTRSTRSETIVPPHMGKLVAYLSKNQVSFGLTTVRIPQGGSNITLGEAQDLSMLHGWLPVSRELHDCRHAPKTGASPACR